MAGIASSRIASGAGVFHKPQAKDAGAANAQDAASPFQQLLDTNSIAQVADGQDPQDQPGSDKMSDKDSKDTKDAKIANKTDQTLRAQLLATTDGELAAKTANDDGNAGSTQTAKGRAANGKSNDTSGTGQSGAPPGQEAALDASQALVAAQISATSQDGKTAKTPDANDSGDKTAATRKAGTQKKADAVAKKAVSTDADPVKAAMAAGSGSIKAGKDTDTIRTKDQDQAAQSSDAAAEKSDHKADKAQDAVQDGSKPAIDQPAPPSAQTVVVASVTPLPAPANTDADTDQDDAIAAATADPAKGAAKNGQPAAAPSGTKAPDQNSGDASAAPQPNPANGAQASNNTAPAQAGSDPTQNADAAQSGSSKTADQVADKGDKQTDAAQPQVQPQSTAQAQPQQPQTAVPAIQAPTQPQAHTGATDGVAQNVQVGPQDSGTGANTVGALAVAIAAKSQSGNKQFDIRLDPPELGRVEVRLSIDSTGKAQASLSADQPRTLDLLKTDAPALTRALRDAGLNVAQNGLNFSLRGQNQQNGGNNNFAQRPNRASQTSLIATSAVGTVQGGANYYGPADGRLDIRV